MNHHRPVMPGEVLEMLAPERGGLVIDATLGMGGHSELLLERSASVKVLGLDRDAESLDLARARLDRFGERFAAVHSDYRRIKSVCGERRIESAAGILADLGISSYQLGTPERGFSFRAGRGEAGQHESDSPSDMRPSDMRPSDMRPLDMRPLDMRMDRSQGATAAELVNRLSERELADLIWRYGEEPASRRIARRIVLERGKAPIVSVDQLADLVVRAVHQKGYWRIHPATRTFQALRIAVNRELEGLAEFVADAVDLLEPEGRLVVITFHSLEDRLIKQAFRFQAGQCQCPPSRPQCECGAVRRVEILTRKALRPQEEEIAINPRARSAKLRACRKLSAR